MKWEKILKNKFLKWDDTDAPPFQAWVEKNNIPIKIFERDDPRIKKNLDGYRYEPDIPIDKRVVAGVDFKTVAEFNKDTGCNFKPVCDIIEGIRYNVFPINIDWVK